MTPGRGLGDHVRLQIVSRLSAGGPLSIVRLTAGTGLTRGWGWTHQTRPYGTLSRMTAQTGTRPGRNEPCHCGSGRKYKHCCLEKDEKEAAAARARTAAEAPAESTEASSTAKPKRPLKPQTEQPWKATNRRGFVPRSRTPRKVGGS
jgi:hypothetical protein